MAVRSSTLVEYNSCADQNQFTFPELIISILGSFFHDKCIFVYGSMEGDRGRRMEGPGINPRIISRTRTIESS